MNISYDAATDELVLAFPAGHSGRTVRFCASRIGSMIALRDVIIAHQENPSAILHRRSTLKVNNENEERMIDEYINAVGVDKAKPAPYRGAVRSLTLDELFPE